MSDRRAGQGIRAARATDARAVAELQVRTWRAAYAGVLPHDVLAALSADELAAAWAGYLGARPPEDRMWVAEAAERVIGFARSGPADDPPEAFEVHGLYVDPAAQGTGAGRALLRTAVDDALARGVREVVLWHFAGNDRAARFYERFGFRLDGARRPSEHGADEVRRRYA